jgi:multiple sugar transport system substrate-binding protein
MTQRISRRSFLKQIGCAGAGLVLASCAPAPAAAPNVSTDGDGQSAAAEAATITMWGGAFLMNANQQIWDASAYAQEHGEITFETTPMPYDQYAQKMAVAVSAGEPEPDVLLVHYPFIRDFIGKGLLVDISDGVERDQFSPDVIQSVVEDGNIVGVPYEIATFVQYYRADVLDDLGLALPANLDQWFEVGHTIQEQAGRFWTILDKADGNISLFQSVALMLNGDIFAADGEVILDTDAGKGVEAAERLLAIADSGFAASVPVDTPEGFEAVKQEEVVGNLVNYAWIHRMQSAITEEDEVFGKWRIGAPPEVIPGGPIATSQNGAYLLVNKLSNNPDAAWAVIKFFGQSVEGVRTLADQFVIMGAYRPGLQDVIDHSAGWAIFGGQRVQAQMAEVALREDLNVITMNPNLGEAQSILNEALVRMYAHEVTPAEAIGEATEKIRAISK